MDFDILSYVIAAAARGWHVFPVEPGGKEPLRGWRWKQHTTTDPEKIRAFWGQHRCNYGIATGPSRLVVIDLDIPKDGETPPPEWDKPGITCGEDVFAALAERAVGARAAAELLTRTFRVSTRRGGTHLYFTAPPDVELGNTSGDRGQGLGWKIDTRACGGYVVGPGSYVDRPDGAGTYTPLSEPATPAAVLPGWVVERLTTTKVAHVPTRPALDAAATRDLAGYATAALRNELDQVLAAAPGTRNHTLNAAAFALGQLVGAGVLPETLVTDALTTAGRLIGLGERECAATVHSGLQAGTREPRGGAA